MSDTSDVRTSTVWTSTRRPPADEIADAIVFLMKNTYVTGSTLTIDGGLSLT
jgi:NAD(P)-dependent dehydrogenase (short-subunit alcohol dehydrogenase family)